MQVVKKGTQANLLVAYMFHEVDEAEEGVEEGSTDSATGELALTLWHRLPCSKHHDWRGIYPAPVSSPGLEALEAEHQCLGRCMRFHSTALPQQPCLPSAPNS